MNSATISIALCTYNGEKFIKEQLDSILGQAYKNLEIIIVDDRSTDNTFDIVTNYANNDKRIKCFKNDTNLGFNKNFERAISLTSGEYIAISDQDDIWLSEKLARLAENIKDNWLIFSNSKLIGDPTRSDNLLNNFRFKNNFKGILLKNYVTGHTTLFKRKFLNHALPFPTKGYYDWWMGFIAVYNNKLAYHDEVLTHYRIHQGSVIQKRLNLEQKKLEEYLSTLSMLNLFLEHDGLDQKDKTFIASLRDAYTANQSALSIPLIKIISNFYDDLLPNNKPRKLLSRLNFAYKFVRDLRGGQPLVR